MADSTSTTSSASDVSVAMVANAHDINLRKIVQEKILTKMIKQVAQQVHGWIVLVVDDVTTRVMSFAVRMSDITDCGVSIIERLELNRQPFPELSAVYFVAPTVESVRKIAKDFADPTKPLYDGVYLYFLSHVSDEVVNELKNHPLLLQRLQALSEVNIDFLAMEKSIFSCDMQDIFHTLYSPLVPKDKPTQQLEIIANKLVSVCATLEEYPYIRYQADQPRMQQLANCFQTKMNDFVAKNSSFSYAPNRGTILFIDRSFDLVSPMMHESTFQAMVYDLLEIEAEDQITYPAETNSGTVMKTAFLNENDKLWIEFRHTHIAKVSEEIGKRMAQLSASNAGSSLGKGKATDLSQMAAALKELPEYREMLGKLSQHLYLAGKALENFTKTSLLDASNVEQSMGTGVDEAGKKLKSSSLQKQLEDLYKNPKLTEQDRARVLAIFLLTQEGGYKEQDKNKITSTARLPAKYEIALNNLKIIGGPKVYTSCANSSISQEDLKEAGKKALASSYSNARYDPKIKRTIEKAVRRTLDENEFPYIIAPPPVSGGLNEEEAKKKAAISLRKKAKGGNTTPSNKDGSSSIGGGDKEFSGEKMIVFMLGGATFSEIRSIYEVRESEKKDILFGTTNFIRPRVFLEELISLHEATPPPSAVPKSGGKGAEVLPLTSGEIHIHMEETKVPAPSATVPTPATSAN